MKRSVDSVPSRRSAAARRPLIRPANMGYTLGSELFCESLVLRSDCHSTVLDESANEVRAKSGESETRR